MRILVCGDRNWKDEGKIREVLSSFEHIDMLIHGDCRGADRIAAKIADELGVPVLAEKARWDAYGKAAGPVRNDKMLEWHPNLVIAFHGNLPASKGTKDMIIKARMARVLTMVVSGE